MANTDNTRIIILSLLSRLCGEGCERHFKFLLLISLSGLSRSLANLSIQMLLRPITEPTGLGDGGKALFYVTAMGACRTGAGTDASRHHLPPSSRNLRWLLTLRSASSPIELNLHLTLRRTSMHECNVMYVEYHVSCTMSLTGLPARLWLTGFRQLAP